jgi:3D (Asp-Asp-Asp) domain-containing protein
MRKLIILGMVASTIVMVGCNEVKDVTSNDTVLTAPVYSIHQFEPLQVESDPIELEAVEEVKSVTYRVTAYCACEKCCGKWALNRPVDENGNPIVRGAGGVELVNGYTVASPLPFGTKIELEGYGIVEVQDRTAKWIVEKYGENIIDIYIDDHDKAWNFGVKYLEGEVVGK